MTAQLDWLEIGKAATKDAWVSESLTTTNYATNPLFVFQGDIFGGDIFLEFDFSDIPQDSVFAGGQLFLRKESESGEDSPHLEIFLNDASWIETGVTWGNAPPLAGYIVGYDSTADPGEDDVVLLSANALGLFVNRGLTNHGMRIRHDDDPENDTDPAYEISYRDRTQPLGPELFFLTIPPPSWIEVPSGMAPITIDGDCDVAEYSDALEVPWIGYGGAQYTFLVKRSGGVLFVCTEGIFIGFDPVQISLQVDADPSDHIVPLAEDWRIVLDPDANTAHTERGTAGLGSPWEAASLTGWSAAGTQTGFEFYQVSGEFEFPLATIGSTGPFSFSLTIEDTTDSDRWGWPTRGAENQPLSWAEDRAAIFLDGFESGNVFAWDGPP